MQNPTDPARPDGVSEAAALVLVRLLLADHAAPAPTPVNVRDLAREVGELRASIRAALTVIDHAARLLASLDGGRVYSGTVPYAAVRVFTAAADLPPFLWLNAGTDTPRRAS